MPGTALVLASEAGTQALAPAPNATVQLERPTWLWVIGGLLGLMLILSEIRVNRTDLRRRERR
jgi:uncharacterized membrane protein YdcZ (DUF606 family)